MMRGDEVILKNRVQHIEYPRDNDAHFYCVNGLLYYRIGNGQPHLVGGQTIIHNYIQSQGGATSDSMRSSSSTLVTAGSHDIVFDSPLGTTGHDYQLHFFVRDADGAVPSYDIPYNDITKYGFRVVTYDNNIFFGWTAILNTQ